jgi:tetratricopeptide (TPR) repeat protein
LGTAYRSFLTRYDESTELYKKALELDPSLENVRSEILTNFLWAKDYSRALEYAKKRFAPESENYYYALSQIDFGTGKLQDAIELIHKIIKLEGSSTDYYYLVILHFLQGLREDWPETLKSIDEFIAKAPSSEFKLQGYLLKSLYDSWLGKQKMSAADLKAAQDLVGSALKWPEEYFKRALVDWARFWLAYDRGDFPECRNSLPDWPAKARQMFFSKTYFKFLSLFARGSLELKEKNLASAEKTLAEMTALIPEMGPYKMHESSSTDQERARYYLAFLKAEMLLAEGSPRQAASELEKATVPEPYGFQFPYNLVLYTAPFLKDTLARAYEQMGDLDKAIAEYERLLRVDEKNPPRFLPHPKYHMSLAKLYERKGNKLKAAGEYRRFLELWKDADSGRPEVEDARSRLLKLKT